MRYANKVALVTGAGHGIGAAIAEKLASEGAAVAVLEINAQTGAAKAKDIEAAGGRACFVEADITDLAQVESAIAETEKALGEVDVLVNNAAYSFAGSLDEIAAELWNREIDVNLNGPYNCIRAVLPAMKARRAGAIVNIASVNGVRYFGSPAYSAAKAAVLNLTQSVASEYGAFGIRCNAVLPGSVRTDAVSWRMRLEKDPQVFEKLAKWYPLGRVAIPEDVAKATAYLGSDDADYITGIGLTVDGGLTAGMNVMIDEFVLEE